MLGMQLCTLWMRLLGKLHTRLPPTGAYKASTAYMQERDPTVLSLLYCAPGYGFKNVLPHFDGFFDFCLRLFGADLAAMQLQVLPAP